MTNNQQIATTILQQLGGNRFVVMTGARNFVAGDNCLIFSLIRAKDGIRKLRITLDATDTYTVECYNTRLNLLPGRTKTGVYCDQLQGVFTELTGLYTRL